MISLKNLLNESVSEYIQLYHGGRKWKRYESTVPTPKRGRSEAGAGIYTTNNYLTASKYAKGSNIVSIIHIKKDIKLAREVNIPIAEATEFVKTYIGPKNRKGFLLTIENSFNRMGRLPADTLINLGVNFDVGGKQSIYIMEFLVEHGVDASIQTQSGKEEWLVIHNTDIIKDVIHTKPNEISVDRYMLKKPSDQITG